MMKRNKIIAISGLTSLAILFTSLYIIIPKLITDNTIRNRNYNPATLKECKSVEINNMISTYTVSFENTSKLIFTRLYTPHNTTINITGYHNLEVKQVGEMKEENVGCYNFSFHCDYNNINSVKVDMKKEIYVSKTVVYYLS